MKITVDLLKEVAKRFNEYVKPDPPIKITSKSTIAELTEEIRATVELLGKGDIVSQKTMDILTELEIDVPAFVKIKDKEEKKVTDKKVTDKKEILTKKVNKKNKDKDSEMKFVSELIEQKKYTRQEIIKLYLKKFPESTKNTINSLVSHGKNPKYNDFEKLIKENKEGVLSF